MSLSRLTASALLSFVFLSGCEMFRAGEGPEPGDALGAFQVKATRATDSCGPGLGSPATLEFDVELRKSEGILYWKASSEPVVGTLAPDGLSFSFESIVAIDMRGDQGELLPPCSVYRYDRAQGVLQKAEAPAPEEDTPGETGDGAGEALEIAGFEGALLYDFAPDDADGCADLVSSGHFQVLPCGVAYSMVGSRRPEAAGP